MELKSLLIGQLVLDLAILVVLVLLGRFYFSRKQANADFQSSMDKAILLIKEMESLGASLEQILEEKRQLTNRLIADLDGRLAKAELVRDEIKKIVDVPIYGEKVPRITKENVSTTRKMIDKLLARGFSKEDVCRHLNLTSGELELILKLDKASTKTS